VNTIDTRAGAELVGDQAEASVLIARARVREAEQAVAAYSWRSALESVATRRIGAAASRHEQEFASRLATLIRGAGDGIRAATESAHESIAAQLRAVEEAAQRASEALEHGAERLEQQTAEEIASQARRVTAEAERARRELDGRIEASLEARLAAAADHFTQQFAQLARELEERLNAALAESVSRLADELSGGLDERAAAIRAELEKSAQASTTAQTRAARRRRR
jgi:predicted metal-dependent hydrolase